MAFPPGSWWNWPGAGVRPPTDPAPPATVLDLVGVNDSGTIVNATTLDPLTVPVDPSEVLAPLAPGEALTVDDQGRPASLGPVVSRDAVIRASRLVAFGHSYVHGIGAADYTRAFPVQVASMLGLPLYHESVSGSVWSSHTSSGGWVKSIRKFAAGPAGAVSGSIAGDGRRACVPPPQDVFLWMAGVNDLNSRGNTAADLAGVKHCLRAAISRYRAGSIYEAEVDPAHAFTGTWPTTTSTTENSGTGFRYTTSAANTYAFTVPAGFPPGGTLAIGVGAREGSGAVHTFTHREANYVLDARNTQPSGGAHITCVQRFHDVHPGDVITDVITNLTALTSIDYAQYESAAPDAPLVVLVKQPYPAGYDAYGNTAPGPPTDAGVDALNAVIDQVAAEFDGNVITVDTSSMDHVTAMFAADKLHPSGAGHDRLAQLVVEAIRDQFRFEPVVAARLAPRVEYGTTAPSGTSTHYRLGDLVLNSAPEASGYIGWVCTVEGSPGTWKPYGAIAA